MISVAMERYLADIARDTAKVSPSRPLAFASDVRNWMCPDCPFAPIFPRDPNLATKNKPYVCRRCSNMDLVRCPNRAMEAIVQWNLYTMARPETDEDLHEDDRQYLSGLLKIYGDDKRELAEYQMDETDAAIRYLVHMLEIHGGEPPVAPPVAPTPVLPPWPVEDNFPVSSRLSALAVVQQHLTTMPTSELADDVEVEKDKEQVDYTLRQLQAEPVAPVEDPAFASDMPEIHGPWDLSWEVSPYDIGFR